jgi:Threonyl-tRNA synthetase
MGGKLPVWLAPTQTVIAAITDEANDYAMSLNNELLNNGIRSELDIRNEQISYKVREHSLQKVPYIIAVGKKEIENQSVSVRRLGSEKTQSILLNDFVKTVVKEAKTPLES